MYWPSQPSNSSSRQIFRMQLSASTQTSLAAACSMGTPSNPIHSFGPLPLPDPNSTRPLEIRSSVATRSATRMGWLICCCRSTMAWPMRMFLVRAAMAASCISGEEEWQYS